MEKPTILAWLGIIGEHKMKTLLATILLFSVPVLASPKEHLFRADCPHVWKAQAAVLKEHYAITSLNQEEHAASFHTGMGALTWDMGVSSSLAPGAEKETCTMRLRTAKRGTQLFAWGQGGRIADDFFKKVEGELIAANEQKKPAAAVAEKKQ